MDLEKYQMHILNTCECDSFITGFRLGAKIMLEVLGGEKSKCLIITHLQNYGGPS